VWVLLLLVTLLILPTLVERLEFAYARGKTRAEAEIAQELLADGKAPTIARFPWVAKAIAPSVVGVQATVIGQRIDEVLGPFRRRPARTREIEQGSGVIVDPAGYIITNNHVVNQAAEVSVQLNDGSQHRAEVVGTDPGADVAVLKISGGNLTAAFWGDSDALEVGDSVLAMGNPFGLTGTTTAGIISAKGRRGIIHNLSYQDFLQTDAAVNPGNSGGPLVDMKGKVVGINTAIVGPTYQGISFAIPSHMVQQIYEQLKKGGSVERGYLGVESQPITAELAQRFNLKDTNGALVARVQPGSPAEEAGIQPGDVIIRWNNRPISDPNELVWAVAGTPVGSQAKVVVIRDGKEQELTVTVGKRPPERTRRR
jgi:serine protease Do